MFKIKVFIKLKNRNLFVLCCFEWYKSKKGRWSFFTVLVLCIIELTNKVRIAIWIVFTVDKYRSCLYIALSSINQNCLSVWLLQPSFSTILHKFAFTINLCIQDLSYLRCVTTTLCLFKLVRAASFSTFCPWLGETRQKGAFRKMFCCFLLIYIKNLLYELSLQNLSWLLFWVRRWQLQILFKYIFKVFVIYKLYLH